jgi:CRISPR-associated protein Cst1
MNIETKINTDMLTRPTGDPFADVGGNIIQYLSQNGVTKGKNIFELIEWMTDVYVKNWDAKVNAFFLNSTITQPAFQRDRKISETTGYFKKLILDEIPGKEGHCRITGKKGKVFSAGRDNHILSGSGTFINFHANFEQGIYLSKEVIIRIYFVPFGLVQLSDKIALIYSNLDIVNSLFVKRTCEQNKINLSQGASGVLRSTVGIPSNAMFKFVDDCLKTLRMEIEFDEEKGITKKSISMNLIHFTNFGASPEMIYYTLNTSVFDFYTSCQAIFLNNDWRKFIRGQYYNAKAKDAIFNPQTEIWEHKKEGVVAFDQYETWKNPIYDKLLNGKSILSNFLKWSTKNIINFQIIENYQIIIKNMDKRTVLKIKEIADFIVVGKSTDYVKKAEKRLNGCKNSTVLRQFLLSLIKENLNSGNETPLITLEEYVEYLVPDGANWRETRDLILIALYQKIHAENINIEIEITEDETEILTENN